MDLAAKKKKKKNNNLPSWWFCRKTVACKLPVLMKRDVA